MEIYFLKFDIDWDQVAYETAQQMDQLGLEAQESRNAKMEDANGIKAPAIIKRKTMEAALDPLGDDELAGSPKSSPDENKSPQPSARPALGRSRSAGLPPIAEENMEVDPRTPQSSDDGNDDFLHSDDGAQRAHEPLVPMTIASRQGYNPVCNNLGRV